MEARRSMVQSLVEQSGDDFFRPLLSGPGVHLVGGATEGALYAGKQRNLSQLVD